MRARLLLPCLSALMSGCLLSGCLLGELRGIDCTDDTGCPSVYFCDVPAAECRQRSDENGPPDLTFVAVVTPDGRESLAPFIDAEEPTPLVLVVENAGAGAAPSPQLSFSPVACIRMAVEDGTFPAQIDALERVEINAVVQVVERGCGNPIIYDWFLTSAGRSTRGTFNLNITRQEVENPGPE